MIVDDDEKFLRIFSLVFDATEDMEMVAQAEDGVEAVRLYAEHRPDVVLMDITMPRLNGLEATSIICRQFPQAQVILFSANYNMIPRQSAKSAGAMGMVGKPIHIDDLLKAIRNIHAGLTLDGQPR